MFDKFKWGSSSRNNAPEEDYQGMDSDEWELQRVRSRDYKRFLKRYKESVANINASRMLTNRAKERKIANIQENDANAYYAHQAEQFEKMMTDIINDRTLSEPNKEKKLRSLRQNNSAEYQTYLQYHYGHDPYLKNKRIYKKKGGFHLPSLRRRSSRLQAGLMPIIIQFE